MTIPSGIFNECKKKKFLVFLMLIFELLDTPLVSVFRLSHCGHCCKSVMATLDSYIALTFSVCLFVLFLCCGIVQNRHSSVVSLSISSL